MPVTRRQFIKRSAGLVTVGMVVPRIWLSEARAEQVAFTPTQKFVVIQLAGGNDGFNTVVPYTDSRYYSLRPTLSFKESELKTTDGSSTLISNQFGLHPSLKEMKDFYDAGKVAIVLGVGYPQPNLSHFLSMDIWHTADLGGVGKGWLGRYADLALIGRPGLTSASIGSLDLPKTFSAEKFVVPNIISFSLYNFIADPNYPGDYNNQINVINFAASRMMPAGSVIASVNSSAFESLRGAQQVQTSVSRYTSSIVYPANNPLASGLQMVAQLMATVPEASLLYVQVNGFDNHSDQIGDRQNDRANKGIGDHATLLRWFSEAIKLFHDDLVEHGLADQVLMLQWSEFGRRPGENASFGTDHGTAAPLFVIGNPVRGGLYGEQPSMAAGDLDPAGNVKFKVDFREVYATILDHWLGADSRLVLGAQYPNVGFL
ncbi:MAG TPA: DUF1501 domain-containing protein [Blastocatellia bacterium]|nr:DUF1501 domain-containing protein [Blastocatellia bacterium]